MIASIYNFNNRLGLLLLVRCSSTGTIEKLVNRKFVMDLESGYIDDVIDILINAIEVNIGEIIAMGNGFPGIFSWAYKGKCSDIIAKIFKPGI